MPVRAEIAAFVVYVGTSMLVAIWIVLFFQPPAQRPFVFEGLKALASNLIVINWLWAVLLLATLVRGICADRSARLRETLVATGGLVLLWQFQTFAFLALEAAHW